MTFRFTRRVALAAMLAGTTLLSAAVPAMADWHDQYKEIDFGITSSENQRDAVARYQGFADYMTKKLGVPFKIHWGTDYAAIIEALHTGKVQAATIGSANFALGDKVMGKMIEPFATSQSKDGSIGYYSVIVVRKDSPYHSVQDLKGKVLAWADPNSTSGYAVPSYLLRKSGIDPDTFFAKTPFSGSHELGIVGVVNGTFDAAADDETNDNASNVTRMEKKGMIPAGQTRNIWKSDLIPNGPWVVRADLPADLKAAFEAAVMAFPKEDPTDFSQLGLGDTAALVPIDRANYDTIISVVRANDAMRHQK